MTLRKTAAIAIVGVLTLLGGAAAFGTWRFFIKMNQHQDFVNLHAMTTAIGAFHEDQKRWPRALDELVPTYRRTLDRDSYGRPWVYVSNEAGYVLASFGRDGIPDRPEYFSARNHAEKLSFKFGENQPKSSCGNPNADTVLSDRGIIRACVRK